MQVQTIDTNAGIELSDRCFGADFNEALVHQAVIAYMAGGRAGTRAQKGRTQVSGGGIKPFRQKGTGRARAGTIRSPLWRGGGKVFAASTRDFSQKINRKMYRGALRSVLSELLRQERLVMMSGFSIESGKTRDAISWLASNSITGSVVLIAKDFDDTTSRAFGNVHGVELVRARYINPALLVGAERVIVAADAIGELEGWLA